MKKLLFYLVCCFIALAKTVYAANVVNNVVNDFDAEHNFLLRLKNAAPDSEFPDGHRETSIFWDNWSITSGEELYSAGNVKKPLSYPITQLCDDNPATTWVFGGKNKDYGLSFIPSEPVTINSLQIMNGYNRRADLFKRNNRVVGMEIWLNGRKAKSVRLSDKMSWHRIDFPRQTVKQIGLIFTDFVKGRDDDLCISEVAFYNGQQKLAWHLPPAVIFDAGNESGDPPQDHSLITPDGKVLSQFASMFTSYGGAVWSPNQRYVAYVGSPKGKWSDGTLWIVDCIRQKTVKQLPLTHFWGDAFDVYVDSLNWHSDQEVELVTAKDGDNKGLIGEKIYKIRVP